MSILLESGGILTTLQDSGRSGFRRFGINPNGAMDKSAAGLVNLLLGNWERAGVLEMHFPAPALRFRENALVAVGGADFGARIDDWKIENWRTVWVEKNSVLRFAGKKLGARAYLAVKNGFAVADWLGSQSTNIAAGAGGFAGRALRRGDELFFARPQIEKLKFNRRIAPGLIPAYHDSPVVRAVAGAEFAALTDDGRTIFQTASFAVAPESNRMGFRLRGAKIELKEQREMISSAVDFGTIQLLPNNQLIVLMADHQTTGGYPRVANVATVDLPILAQLAANDRVRFQIVSQQTAEDLLLRREAELDRLRAVAGFL